jgi:phosphoribosylamine--glycine ligase
VGVVLAAAGCQDPRKGDPITGLPKATDDCHVFHAGTTLEGKKLTATAPVLCVTALGDSLKMARTRPWTRPLRRRMHAKDIGFARCGCLRDRAP